jgi:hypothetical protein
MTATSLTDAHFHLVKQVRVLALGLDLIGEPSILLEERTGYRTCLEMAQTEDVAWVYEQLAKRINLERFIYQGEASYDFIRRAKPELLRAALMLAEATMEHHADGPLKTDCAYLRARLAATACVDELERRGISE